MGYRNNSLLRNVSADIMLKPALHSKLRNPGVYNPRVEMAIQSCVSNSDDKNLIDYCYGLMEDISVERRNTQSGSWQWSHYLGNSGFSYELIVWICNLIGCWYDDNGDRLYTDSNHPDWQSW